LSNDRKKAGLKREPEKMRGRTDNQFDYEADDSIYNTQSTAYQAYIKRLEERRDHQIHSKKKKTFVITTDLTDLRNL